MPGNLDARDVLDLRRQHVHGRARREPADERAGEQRAEGAQAEEEETQLFIECILRAILE